MDDAFQGSIIHVLISVEVGWAEIMCGNLGVK